ncbi:HpcH/HpaI aldolase/citrate lyase family protein [Chloroflexota bacterium]
MRRSHLLVSVLQRDDVESSWTHGTDAVILDLADSVPASAKGQAREMVRESIPIAARGGAEVFVRVNKPLLHADVEASVWPGLVGIVHPNAEAGAEIEEEEAILEEMEKRRGIAMGTLQIIVLLDTGKGVWNVREIIKANPRVCSVGLDESNLCRNLGIVPDPEFDPFVYTKGRIVIEGTAARVQPVGISHPYGALPRFGDAEEVHRLILRGRNLGFKGTICPHSSWVELCNRAYTPTEEQVAYYREVRQLFSEGVARGTAAVPYRDTGRMIDVPVDERARMIIGLWERCAARETEKAAALERAR